MRGVELRRCMLVRTGPQSMDIETAARDVRNREHVAAFDTHEITRNVVADYGNDVSTMGSATRA